MPDVTGYRAKFAVIAPSTNTVVEHDFNAMGPHGITFHTGRMYIADPAMGSDQAFVALLGQIRHSIDVAIRDVLTCQPDYLVMGMSAETFWDGVAGNQRFTERVTALSGGLGVTTGASACREALERFGARRISILSPYQPVADENVTRFFTESGFEVVRFHGLRCPTATSIAEVGPDELRPVLTGLAADDPDAIVQVGTNLSMVALADEAERWLGRTVIAINAATLWHALRANGFTDRIAGAGRLLREF
ncbi:MAG TPA: arylmalonate decarboxylase [Mycobacteriales bacterium]|nr:arylmalonate decarboxylase [Mycobacteriales bacterium]